MTFLRITLACAAVVALGAGQPAAQSQLRLTYLGTAGWEITDGTTIVLVDPYLTRAKYGTPNDAVSPDNPRPIVTNSSIVPSDTTVIDQHITRANVPSSRTRTRITRWTCRTSQRKRRGRCRHGKHSNLARASSIPESQLKSSAAKRSWRFLA